jgi:hypothetical protein
MKTKLLNSIEAKMTGQKMPVDTPFIVVAYSEKQDHAYIPLEYAHECRIGVHLGGIELIHEKELRDNADLAIEHAKKRIGRGIANQVYGELHDKLIELAYQIRREGYRPDNKSLQMIEQMIESITYD